jgi:hypothetical protein
VICGRRVCRSCETRPETRGRSRRLQIVADTVCTPSPPWRGFRSSTSVSPGLYQVTFYIAAETYCGSAWLRGEHKKAPIRRPGHSLGRCCADHSVRRRDVDSYLSIPGESRFAVLYVIPPGFGRPIGREFGQAIDTAPFLFDQLNFSHAPCLIEPGVQRAVEPEEHVPPLAGDCLRPVRLWCSLW